MFDPVRICTILNEEGVDYVVVWGVRSGDSRIVTSDSRYRHRSILRLWEF